MTDDMAVTARQAASVLILRDDPFEVLVVRRNANQSFASALVFPGGMVEAGDASEAWLPLTAAEGLDDSERALRIAALREVHEECGLFIGAPLGAGSVYTADFATLLAESSAPLKLGALVHFGHWVTPVQRPKRFDTHFFLARAPVGQVARSDGSETVSLEWVRPVEVMAQVERGERELLFPTLMNMKRLAESDSVEAAISAARARPPFTVQPDVRPVEGGMLLSIPEAAGYGQTQFMSRSPIS